MMIMMIMRMIMVMANLLIFQIRICGCYSVIVMIIMVQHSIDSCFDYEDDKNDDEVNDDELDNNHEDNSLIVKVLKNGFQRPKQYGCLFWSRILLC